MSFSKVLNYEKISTVSAVIQQINKILKEMVNMEKKLSNDPLKITLVFGMKNI